MKKSSSLLITFLVTSLTVFSQVRTNKASIQWGDEQKESKKSTMGSLIAHDESGIYVTKYKSKMVGWPIISLEHFDKKLNKTKSVLLELGSKRDKRNLEHIIHLNNKIFLFSSSSDNETKKNSLFVETINKRTLLSNNDIEKISEINFSGNKRRNSGDFNYEISRDSSKILIYSVLPYEKNESAKFKLLVLDNNLEKIWANNITLPYNDNLFKLEDYKISNKGNVYLVGKIYDGKKIEKKKRSKTDLEPKPNYKYKVLSYNKKESRNKEYLVEVEDYFISQMKIAIDENENIICAGFYSELSSFGLKGSYFLKIDGITQKIITKNFKDFGIDFITQNMTVRQEKKVKKRAEKKKKPIELYEYDLDNIILKEDGGAILIGEQFFIRVVTRTTTDANGNTTTTTTYYYYYNDIIVINISPKGEIEWTEKIPKRQITTNDGGFYSSYALTEFDDKLYFIFNDNPKNLFYKGEGKIYNFNKGKKESLVVLVELNMDGEQTREALFSMKDAEVIIRPKVCEQISKNQMILFGQKKKIQRFAKVTFEK